MRINSHEYKIIRFTPRIKENSLMKSLSFTTIILSILCLAALPAWTQQSPSTPNALQGPAFIPGGGIYNPGINGVRRQGPDQQSGSKGSKNSSGNDAANLGNLDLGLESNVKVGGTTKAWNCAYSQPMNPLNPSSTKKSPMELFQNPLPICL